MNTKIISGVLASALLLSTMAPVTVLADTTDTTTEPGPSTEVSTELKDTVIDIKDATMKATFGEGKKTFTYTSTQGITPVVTSSDTSVATVEDKNGVVTVTILKAGTTRIEVAFEGNEEYKAASDYIDLTVEKAAVNVGITAYEEDLVGGGVVSLYVSGVPDGVTAVVECNVSGITVTKGEGNYYTAVVPDDTKAYKFIVTTNETDNYESDNSFCTVYVTSLEDSFVEEVLLGEEEIKAAVVDETVIMDTLTVSALEDIIDEEEIEGALSFDFTNAYDDVESIRLDRTTIRAFESIMDDNYYDIECVEFVLASGTLSFDMDAWAEIVDNCTTSGTTFSLTTHKVKEMNNRQQKALKEYDVYKIIDFKIVGKKTLTEVDGTMTIALDNTKNKTYSVYSMTTRGELDNYKAMVDSDSIIFDTDTCALYVVVEGGSSNTNNNNSNNSSNTTDYIQGYEKNKVMILTIDSKLMQLYGNTYVNDVAPIIKNSRTMLPIRIIAENLGSTVTWDGNARKVTVTRNNIHIEIFIDSSYARVNGQTVILDSPAFISNNRTYLPVRFIAENLGATVIWDDYSREVIISPDKK